MFRNFSTLLLLGLGLFSAVRTQAQTDSTKTIFPSSGLTQAQKLIANTGEDLLTGNNAGHAQTVLSGYGEAYFQRNNQYKDAKASLRRAVLFVGHQFNSKVAFFSELEVSDARFEAGDFRGGIGLEQCYLKFSINPRHYILAGLILPRIGITNENHLPVNYFGTDRPMVETMIIPSTWQELGIAYYGQMSTLPISYNIGIMNGLNATRFTQGTGIANGKGGGQLVSMNSMALSASAQAYVRHFKFQVSGYAGGSIPYSSYQADSLKAPKGIFAAPVMLAEADVQYYHKGIYAKALATYVSIPQASEINVLSANNTPKSMYGAYVELGYNVFEHLKSKTFENKQLVAFARYEKLNANQSIPSNGIIDGTLDQNHFITGLNYFPTQNVVLKADIRFTSTGPQNKALFLNPPPVMMPYPQQNSFLNLGIGYSF